MQLFILTHYLEEENTMFIKQLFSPTLILCSLLTSPFVGALSIGSVDTFIGKASLPNSGEGTELNWANSLLMETVTFGTKIEQDNFSWSNMNDLSFLSVSGSPAYYLLKFGNGSLQADSHYLFKNEVSLDHIVIDSSDSFFNDLNANEGRLSHITTFNGGVTTTSIPEPMTLAILMMALLGIRLMRKGAQ